MISALSRLLLLCYALITVPSGAAQSVGPSHVVANDQRQSSGFPGAMMLSGDAGVGSDVYLLRRGAEVARNVTRDEPQEGAPQWSPDRSTIAMSRGGKGSYESEIYTMKPDGSGIRRLTRNEVGDATPSWSPSGGRLVTVRLFRGGTSGPLTDLIMIDLASGDQVRLTRTQASENEPDWSPVQNRIVFTFDSGGNRDIWSMRSDGSHARRVYGSPAEELSPVWAPNGKRIAFIRRLKTGTTELCVMRSDGTGKRTLVRSEIGLRSPAWASSGKKLAFIDDSNFQPYVLDLASEEVRRRLRDEREYFSLDW